MAIHVLIEPLANDGFRARSGEPIALSAEAPTREEALTKWKDLVRGRLKDGAELVSVELAPEAHPWMEFAGMFDPGDPMVRDWEKAMAEYRRKVDQHPERP